MTAPEKFSGDPDGGFEHIDIDDLKVQKLMPELFCRNVVPGSHEWSWSEEVADLWQHDLPRMSALLTSIAHRGVCYPVRVAKQQVSMPGLKATAEHWYLLDGHHRVAVCLALQVPVPFVVYHEQEDGELRLGT